MKDVQTAAQAYQVKRSFVGTTSAEDVVRNLIRAHSA